MAFLLIWLLIYIQLMDSALSNEMVRIGALFTNEEKDSQLELAFKFAVYRINKDPHILPNTTLIYDIQYIQQIDSFHASKKACLQVSNGVSAIFGPKDPELGVHIQSICDALDIPHLEARLQNLGERDISREFSVNLHPGSLAISESLRELILYLNWTKVAIIYQDDMSLIGLQELVKPSKMPKIQFVFRKCNDENFREILVDIRSRNIYSMIVDIRPSSLNNLLTAILQVQMNDYKYHYHFTTFDIETIDLENFRYNFVNMTAFRLVDSNNAQVRSVLHDIEKFDGLKFQSSDKQILNRSNVIEAAPALMFDSVYVLAYALNELLKNNIILHSTTNATCEQDNPWPHGSSLFNYINLVEYAGLTGKVQFKEGVRSSVKLDLMKLRKNSLDKVGEWNREAGKLEIIKPEAFHEFGPSNITLLVTTIEHPPYIMRKKDSFNLTGNQVFEGFCIDLLALIAEQLGFHYKLYLVPDGKFGAKNIKTNQWNGMVRELMDKKADLAVAPMTITYTRESVIDFSKPFMSLGCYQDETARDYLENQFSIGDSFWFLVVTLMKQVVGVDLNPKAFSTRIIGGIWWFFTLILISSYTANLAAFLTVERMITPIEDVEDLAAQTKIQYGALQNGSTMTFFRDSKIATYQRMWKYMNSTPGVFVKTYEEGLKRVLKGSYAFLMESTMLDYMVQRDCNLTQVGYLLDSKGYGIATPLGSPWRDRVSLAILDLQEKGVITMLYEKWWKSGLTCIRDEIKNKDGKANPLDFQNIGGVFVVLLIGLVMAVIVAFIEFVCKYKNKEKTKRQSLCNEMLDELKFAIKCGASRQRPVLRRSCSNCSLAKSGKATIPISRIHSFNSPTLNANFLPHHSKLSNLNSLSNGNLQLISNNETGSFPSHLHHSHQYLHHHPSQYQPHSLMHSNSIYPNRAFHSNKQQLERDFKNYKLSSFNDGNNLSNYCRSMNNDLYGLPLMPYSLQNLLLLDPADAAAAAHHHHPNDQSTQFNNDETGVGNDDSPGDLPTPPPPPNIISQQQQQQSAVANKMQSNLKSTLIKQRSLAAIESDQFADVHLQHHIQSLAHQFAPVAHHSSSRQLSSSNHLHRTLSNDNFDKCNLINQAVESAVRRSGMISQTDDLLFTSQDYSPDLDVPTYRGGGQDNQTGN